MEEKQAPRPREEKNRTDGTNGTDRTYEPPLIPAHGGYRKLKSYQTAEIIYDATVTFCDRFIDRRSQVCSVPVRAYKATPYGVTTSQPSLRHLEGDLCRGERSFALDTGE